MTRRTRLLLGCAGPILILALAFLAWTRSTYPPPLPGQTWKPQPDRFPLGTTFQSNRIEFSLAAFTRDRPPAPPTWTDKLPKPLQQGARAVFERLVRWKAIKPWRLKADAPPFVKVRSSTLDYAPQGVRVWLELVADTSKTGTFRAPLVLRLRHQSGQVQSLTVPIKLEVLSPPLQPRGRILISETPFDGYSTEDGAAFESLATITAELARRDTLVEFLDRPPRSLEGYSSFLVAGGTLSGLTPSDLQSMRGLLARGGRVILTPDAFFGGTANQANLFLAPYGLQVGTRDAGNRVESTNVVADLLTDSVHRLSFWRPASVTVTDRAQGKELVLGPAGECLIAVSRAPDRGDIVVLTQSLWWGWIHSDVPGNDNARFLLNVLSP